MNTATIPAQLLGEAERFWRNVAIGAPNECWEWKGKPNEAGYGRFTSHGRTWRAHEFALSVTTGEMRGVGQVTCHSCDNPPCCNPSHLRFASPRDNAQDAVERGRTAKGERCHLARLTEAEVVAIRERRALGTKFSVLACDYDVAVSTISAIVRGERWSHAGGPIERLPMGRPTARGVL